MYCLLQKAISKLDKYSQREVLDNEWLTREVRDKFFFIYDMFMTKYFMNTVIRNLSH